MKMDSRKWTSLLVLFCVLLVTCHSFAVADDHKMFDPNIVSPHCLETAPKINSNYTPTGFKYVFNENLTIYETKAPSSPSPQNGSKLLIAAYDIFGFHPNTEQVVDSIAEASGIRAIMPDFFRGGWPTNDFPPKDKDAFTNFVNTNGSWENVSRDLRALIQHYKTTQGVTEFGIFGFCWGGKVAMLAASSPDLPEIKAAGLIHPSSIQASDADKVRAPMYLLPSKSEPDMLPIYDTLVKKFGAANVGHKRFDDMPHGFAGARGNFDDPLNRERVEEVVQILQEYFKQQL